MEFPKFTIQQKILAVIAVIIIFLIFNSIRIVNIFSQQDKIYNQEKLVVTITNEITLLINDIEREKSLSLQYLIYPNTKTTLINQFNLTNQKLNRLKHTIFKHKIEHINNLLSQIAILNSFRKNILLHKVKKEDILRYYSNLNKMLLNVISSYLSTINSNNLTKNIMAMFYFLKLKESIEEENTIILTNNTNIQQKLNHLLLKEKIYINSAIISAKPYIKNYYITLISPINEELNVLNSLTHTNKTNSISYLLKIIYSKTKLVDKILQEIAKENNKILTSNNIANKHNLKIAILNIIFLIFFVLIPLLIIQSKLAKKASHIINKLEKLIKTLYLNKKVNIDDEDDELNKIVEKLNQFIEIMRNSIANIKENSIQLSKLSNKNINDTTELIKLVNKQNSTIFTLSNETTYLQENISKTEEKVIDTSDKLTTIFNFTNTTIDKIKLLQQHLQESYDKKEQINTNISKMESEIQKIYKNLKNVKHISEKVNLLSLNAYIEAARLKENNRKFSLVADEIKQLSEKIKDSIIDIEDIIQTHIEKIDEIKSFSYLIIHNSEKSLDITKSVSTNMLKTKYFIENTLESAKDATIFANKISFSARKFIILSNKINEKSQVMEKITEKITNNITKIKNPINEISTETNKFKV